MPKFCEFCGSPLEEEMKFCSSCGKVVIDQPNTVQSEEPASVASQKQNDGLFSKIIKKYGKHRVYDNLIKAAIVYATVYILCGLLLPGSKAVGIVRLLFFLLTSAACVATIVLNAKWAAASKAHGSIKKGMRKFWNRNPWMHNKNITRILHRCQKLPPRFKYVYIAAGAAAIVLTVGFVKLIIPDSHGGYSSYKSSGSGEEQTGEVKGALSNLLQGADEETYFNIPVNFSIQQWEWKEDSKTWKVSAIKVKGNKTAVHFWDPETLNDKTTYDYTIFSEDDYNKVRKVCDAGEMTKSKRENEFLDSPYLIGTLGNFHQSKYAESFRGYDDDGVLETATVSGYECKVIAKTFDDGSYLKQYYYGNEDYTILLKSETFDASGNLIDQAYSVLEVGKVTDADVTSPDGSRMVYDADGTHTSYDYDTFGKCTTTRYDFVDGRIQFAWQRTD